MGETVIILRRWSSRIRSADEPDYVAYIEATGLKDYRAATALSAVGDRSGVVVSITSCRTGFTAAT